MTYKGSCHCGAVKFSFTLETPLEDSDVVKCNCSMCTRNGYLLVYPKGSDMTFDHAEDAVTVRVLHHLGSLREIVGQRQADDSTRNTASTPNNSRTTFAQLADRVFMQRVPRLRISSQ
jgi:hypothetical protein